MIVIDVETTGVDPNKCSLLSIGAVDFNEPSNIFYGECCIWAGAHIEPEALVINGFTENQIHDSSKKTDKELLIEFIEWVDRRQETTFAGHNTSFDRDFLRATALRYHLDWKYAHRTIDLHSIAYFQHVRRSIVIPIYNKHSALNLDTILGYAGMPVEPKPHNGLMGARLEAEVFCRLFYDRPLFEDFRKYSLPWNTA